MINWNDFEDAAVSQLSRDISRQSNPDQNRAIQAPLNQSLFIVAGPGSGKTTVIALRVLKLIFIDDTDASNILVTTFTRKAAAELRSRMLGWGDRLRRSFMSDPSYYSYRDRLRRLDLNRIITGTLDSIAEETLGDYRAPGIPPPVVIEDFVSNALMIRAGLFSHGRHNNQDLRDYVAYLRGTLWGLNVAEISATLREIKDRFFHDQIEVDRFRNNSSHCGVPVVCDAIHNYIQELESEKRPLFDFVRIEQEFLDKLRDGTLNEFLQNIKFVLVDEYQDTNLLQEQIYFELANSTLRKGGSVAAVGDDDQSLYRFRGATVDLFERFQNRINNRLGINPTIIHLSRNYRSTPIIIDFCDGFVNLDRQFQGARVQNKPQMRPLRPQPYTNYPIFGMFRTTINVLAHDLAQFIHRVIRGGGVQISDHQGNQYTIRVHPQHGTPADIALLSISPQESRGTRQRLPLLLRSELRDLDPPIQVFNPRGRSLETIFDVQVLCGLALECIDLAGRVQDSTTLPQDATNMFNIWRRAARDFMSRDPSPSVRTPYSLRKFVCAWQSRTPLGRRTWEEREISPLSLIYKLITWIPNMQNDIEGLVYLEAITRTISQVGLFGDFGGQIIFDRNNPRLERASIKEALWNIFVPIASGAIEIEEDLLETLPPDRVNIMSIHQAKGLEFPLVIVDVGSDFRTDHPKQAFLRFPTSGGREHNIENELRPFSLLRPLQRPVLDRAFDDLIRKYFVAYSRAQDVLLLVGLIAARDRIQNVATGWDRDGNCHWKSLSNLVHIQEVKDATIHSPV